MNLTFIGATETVTGSMILGRTNGFSFLVDAGLYQGLDTPKVDQSEKELDELIKIKELDAIFLTHAHLDHCGYIPRLFRLGFKGKVYCTEETKLIAKVIMNDNARIEQERVKKHNKKITKEKLKLEPFYSIEDVTRAYAAFSTVKFNQSFVIGGVKASFIRSGHILGAASILMEIEAKRYLFSGDIGKEEDILHLPKEYTQEKVDYLVMESTYGDRLHSMESVQDQLKSILESALKAKKRIIIPAFSFGRSQMILSLLTDIFNESKELKMPVFLDSPMSSEILTIYEMSTQELKVDKNHINAMKENCRILEFPKERESILQKETPYIVLTSSGMISGGPALYYLEKCGGLEDTIILITGYQARGTYGYDLTHENLNLFLNEKDFEVRAEIIKLSGLSSHGDQNELIHFAKAYGAEKVFLVHGEKSSKETLKERLSELSFDAVIPSASESVELD
tara:strand:- start:109638 stop:110996 length:1359 start_codon:yes stop_codon:yes gene_type:complete